MNILFNFILKFCIFKDILAVTYQPEIINFSNGVIRNKCHRSSQFHSKANAACAMQGQGSTGRDRHILLIDGQNRRFNGVNGDVF